MFTAQNYAWKHISFHPIYRTKMYFYDKNQGQGQPSGVHKLKLACDNLCSTL